MSEEVQVKEEKIPRNFITDIIDEDLQSGKVQEIATRFPPEPNGYLHIGHAKSICLNFGLARDYHGTCNLRFDDTNPVKEDMEYIQSIERDVQWLGFKWSGPVRHSSDYFDLLFNYALELIDQGLAYVDELSPDEIREYRGTLKEPGRESPYRNRSIEENRELFLKMRDGGFEEGKACLRAKIDMASPFICMRDPVIYRVRYATHALTGDKWCIYPIYDYAHPMEDALEGVTYSLCDITFRVHREVYDWFVKNCLDDPYTPKQREFSTLNLENVLLGKRYLKQLVENKVVMGTISGLRRRGYTPESIREFCRRIGVTKQENTVEMSALESCVRDDLNANAKRAMAVLHPLRLVIDNYGEEGVDATSFTVPYHNDKPELGTREVSFSKELYIDEADFREEANKQYKRLKLGFEVRLRHSYIIKATSCEKDENGKVICVHAEAVPNSAGRDVEGHKPKGVIHYVDANNCYRTKVHLYGRLFKVPNPGSCEDFLSTVDLDSCTVIENAALEASLKNAKSLEHFQFEREGYFCVDSKSYVEGQPQFNLTVPLREAKKANV